MKCIASAVTSLLLASAAHAADYPSRPIHFIIGSAPGSVIDVVTRQLADRLAAQLDQKVIVENRPSAGGIVALGAVKASPPDGYTLSTVAMPQLCVSPALFPHLPYDPVNDFAPVGILYRGPQFLVVHADVKARTFAELVELSRLKKGTLRYSSPGNGTPSHVLMEEIRHQSGADIQHIPYKGPTAYTAVLAGEVDALLEGVGPMLPYVQSGQLRALAVTGNRRIASMPAVPTFEELGIRGIDAVWVGIVAPRGTPPAIVELLNAQLALALRAPQLQASFEAAGRAIAVGTPQEMTDTVKADLARWRDVVKRAGIVAE